MDNNAEFTEKTEVPIETLLKDTNLWLQPHSDKTIVGFLHRKNPFNDLPPELEGRAQEFRKIFDHLPEVARIFASIYRKHLQTYNLDPGEIRIYLVGGRLTGRPLTKKSDIDFLCAASNPKKMIEQHEGVFTGHRRFSYRIAKAQDIILDEFSQALKEMDLLNAFHIDWGAQIPECQRINKPLFYLCSN